MPLRPASVRAGRYVLVLAIVVTILPGAAVPLLSAELSHTRAASPSAPQPGPSTFQLPTIVLHDDGTDWGKRINAADARLRDRPGVIMAEGGGHIATQVVLGSRHTLWFGPGTWTNSNTAETFLLKDHTALEGHGWDTIIQEPSGGSELSYFIMRPYVTHLDGGGQANDISVRNIQFSGVGVRREHSASASTVNTGLLRGGIYDHIWFNKTHAIGLTVGETNVHGTSVTENVAVQGCKFTNVGGGTPPNYPGGGGVSLAIINGQNITVANNVFIDALGNTILDIEPNSASDPVTNISITGNQFSEEGTTGVAEPYVYGVVTHDEGGPFGPVIIENNIFQGTHWLGPDRNGIPNGGWYPGWTLLVAIYIDYAGAVPEHDVRIVGNVIKWTSAYPIVIDGGSFNNTVLNNNVFMPGNNIVVTGHHNTVRDNYVATAASQGAYCFGIEERSGDYNMFLNNQTTGDSFQANQWIINPGTNYNCSGLKSVILAGPHSISRGNVVIPRPPFP